MCQIQHRAGRGFVFEHPSTASSWEDECLRTLMDATGVFTSMLDMCRYGMTSVDKQGEGPVRKTTRILSNVYEISDALSLRCEGGIGMFSWSLVARRMPPCILRAFVMP